MGSHILMVHHSTCLLSELADRAEKNSLVVFIQTSGSAVI
jgi:hypothetical protein